MAILNTPANPAWNGKNWMTSPRNLAEFDLRCAAGDYDTAAMYYLNIDLDYLLLWGHYRMMIDLHLESERKDYRSEYEYGQLEWIRAGVSKHLGDAHESVLFLNRAFPCAREVKSS